MLLALYIEAECTVRTLKQAHNYVVSSHPIQTNTSTMPHTNKVPTNWHLSFQIPPKHTFSGVVQKAIETGVVCAKARWDIVQTLRTLILQHTRYPSSEEYTTISRKLIEKFPKLHDGGTSGFVSRVVLYSWHFNSYIHVLHAMTEQT